MKTPFTSTLMALSMSLVLQTRCSIWFLTLIIKTCSLPGCVHPDYEGTLPGPAAYLRWYARNGPVRDSAAPTVAVLLYRKHVRSYPSPLLR